VDWILGVYQGDLLTESVTDLEDENGFTVYGDSKCHDFAHMNAPKINQLVSINGESIYLIVSPPRPLPVSFLLGQVGHTLI
jgi:hypothetical protein